MGGVLWPIIVRRLIAQVGFAWMARISGFITLACLMTGTLLMKQRSKPPGKRRLTPNFALLKRPAFCSFFFSIAFGYFGLCASALLRSNVCGE